MKIVMLVLISLSVFSLAQQAVIAQQPAAVQTGSETSVVIQFKIFDANKPRVELHPDLTRRPIIFLRNLDTNVDELFLGNAQADAEIKESRDREGFYEITLPKGRLINDLAIDVREANTNVAAITKVVTANNIVVYPGASKSLEDFTFTAFQAQLGRYHSLMTQFVDQFSERREEIRGVLISRYATNLSNMQTVLDSNKVSFARLEQQEAARKMLNDVLVLYGIQPTRPTPKADTYAVASFCRRCGVFRRRH